MILAPSILSLDYAQFSKQLEIVNEKCKWIHFDVMDGHFVPNISFGPDIFKAFRHNSSLFMDVHLMVSDPIFIGDMFVKAGADGITFHFEACDDIYACLDTIAHFKNMHVKVGVSIKPGTSVEQIIPLLKYVDLVLVMSVEPGFGGQKFMEDSLSKIEQLDKYRKENDLNYLIEVDGGINDKNIYKVSSRGCDVAVAGSSVFKGDMEENIRNLSI